jgi:recombination protein RecT
MKIIESDKDKNYVESVKNSIQQMAKAGSITIPEGYDIANAFHGAYLILQETEDKNGKPALEVCSKASIANSLLKMIVMGLNPIQNHCYFIVYGNKLQLPISYFGNQMIVKRDCGVKNIIAHVIREGDKYETKFNLEISKREVKVFETSFNSKSKKILGVFVYVYYNDGTFDFDDYSIAQIEQSWKMGYKGKQLGDSHKNFSEEMAIKTAKNKILRGIINSNTKFGEMSFEKEETIDTTYTEIVDTKKELPIQEKEESKQIKKQPESEEKNKTEKLKQEKVPGF